MGSLTIIAFCILLFIIFPGYLILRIVAFSLPGREFHLARLSSFRTLIVSSFFGTFPFLLTLTYYFDDLPVSIQTSLHSFLSEGLTLHTFDIIPILAKSTFIFIIFTCILFPFSFGIIFGFFVWLLTQIGFVGFTPEEYMQSAWDYYFFRSKYMNDILIITTSDNGIIIGSIGKKGFVSAAHQSGDLYLTKLYDYNQQDNKIFENQSSVGLWLKRESISKIEIFQLDAVKY